METLTPIWIGPAEVPANLAEACPVPPRALAPADALQRTLDLPEVAVIDARIDQARQIASGLCRQGVVTLLLGASPGGNGWPCLALPGDTPAAELAMRIETASSAALACEHLVEQARQARQSSEELDEELRLASSLQQDFMPRRLPEVGPLRFGVFHRPASYVSGDMYDVTRLDETHVGFYVADAVGHGLPAALLTMFIKKALQTKRITGNTYEIIPPDQALQQLNADLCRQNLSMCEFCTALYAIVDTAEATLTYCRAGHPKPVLLRDGQASMLESSGPLLGIMDDATFDRETIELRPGDRLMVYSDGVEDSLCGRRGQRHEDMIQAIAPWVDLDRVGLLEQIAAAICTRDMLDDSTAVVAEVL